MLRSVKEIHNYVLQAEDGEIGRCKDILFDDRFWTVRYMVADTSKWLIGRKVLLSPISLGEPNWSSNIFPIRLTKKQIEDSPDLDENAPVSRQHEILWTQYYGWPYYWGGSYAWGSADYPGMLYNLSVPEYKPDTDNSGDEHLRSAHEVSGYNIQATDDEIGNVADFIIDDKTWTIQYIVVDTGNWLPGKKVLISPVWIESVDWEHNTVKVAMIREQIKNSPEYNPAILINREYEAQLYDFYGRPKYW